MKRNALTRIILFSCIILLLSAGLILGIIDHYRPDPSVIEEAPIEVSPAIVDTQVLYPRIATADVNVRSSPSTEASAIGVLKKGEWVDVVREETVDIIAWSYVTGPVQGWVASEYLGIGFESEEEPAVEETMVSADTVAANKKSTFQPDQVREIEIEWTAGHILLLPADTDVIQVSEKSTSDNSEPMVCRLKEGTLSIDFCRNEDVFLSISDLASQSKDLTVFVPKDWVCQSLEVDAASAALEVNDLTVGEVEFDSASGACEFRNCTVDRMDVDTASGDIRFLGSLQYLDVDAVSAGVLAVLSNNPKRLSMDSMSGDLDITLPQDSGFTLTLDGLSTELTSDFQTTRQNGDYLSGDGSCRILLSATSGDVFLRKAATP